MGIINALKAIGHGIKVAAIHIGEGFAAMFGKQVAADFAHASLAMLKSELGKAVLAEVAALKDVTISGAEKRAKVLEIIGAAFTSATESEIRLLIQLAYNFATGIFQVEEA